jgi:AhpD family alkylhydroperoxidase
VKNFRGPRLHLVDADAVPEPAHIIRLLAKSHAALEGYLGLRNALARGRLDIRLRVLIAILVAEANGCAYGLSAHVATARRAGLEEDVIGDARRGRAADARTDAVLRFVSALVHAHGSVSDDELAALRAAGFDDDGIVEVVSNVGLQLLTGYAALCAALPPDDDPVVPFVYGP